MGPGLQRGVTDWRAHARQTVTRTRPREALCYRHHSLMMKKRTGDRETRALLEGRIIARARTELAVGIGYVRGISGSPNLI